MIDYSAFPRLKSQNHRVTSPSDVTYNCVAWAAQDDSHWWQPGEYWPLSALQEDVGIGALIEAFQSLGFEICQEGSSEAGKEKVALFGTDTVYTHAARQLPSGKWTSKLGKEEDVEHESAEAVGGGLYGEVKQFMQRKIQ